MIFMDCNSQSKSHNFTSEFGYSIMLPENWDKYEDDENVDAFFDTSKWTGNFRIAVLNVNEAIDEEFIEDNFKSHIGNAKKFTTQNGLKGFRYFESSKDGIIYYWHLFQNKTVFICSFLINTQNVAYETEIGKVSEIVNSIKKE